MIRRVTPPRRSAALPVLSLVLSLVLAACATVVDIFVPHHNQSVDLSEIPAGRYRLDPAHAALLFEVDHMGYSRYVARFNRLQATFLLDRNAPERAALEVIIDSAGVDAADAEMDALIAGPKLLDSARYPEIRFDAAGMQVLDARRGRLQGILHLKGRRGPVALDVTFNGGAKSALTGQYILGFSASGRFQRSEFGVSAYLPLVGDEVILRVEAEFYLEEDG